MEERSTESVTSPPGAGKSKLDTLSKEDLIKFAKKQMASMQKMKSKYSDLEKEVDALKAKPNSSSDDSIIKELTERMDAVLLEKAETQQSLVLLRKENEKAKLQAQEAVEKLVKLQEQLDHANNEHLKKIEILERNIEISDAKHKEELEDFQILMKEKREKEQSEEMLKQKEVGELDAKLEEVRQSYEDRIVSFQQQLEMAESERITEIEALGDAHQTALSESQQELENLQEEIAGMSKLHEEEVRDLEEQLEANAADFEMERERLLLLQDELSEQLELKESYLQDVQEEEEDPNRVGAHKGTGVVKILDFSGSDDQSDEEGRSKVALEDLQSKNTMLQDELTYLSNVKSELEADLLHVKEEFRVEREEMEFKINELQMTKEDGDSCLEKGVENLHITNEQGDMSPDQHKQELQALKELHKTEIKELEMCLVSSSETEKETMNQEVQELRNRCEQLSMERSSAIDEYENAKTILRNLESELGDKTEDFVKQYNTMKEQGASAVQELHEKLRVAFNEKDSLLEKMKIQELTLEESLQKVQAAEELNTSLEDLRKKNGEILSQLQQKETFALELEEMLTVTTSDKQTIQLSWEKTEAEMEKMREDCKSEEAETTRLAQNFESLSKDSAEMQRRLEHLSLALEGALAEKESVRIQVADLESQLSEVTTEKDQYSSRLSALTEELAALEIKEGQSPEVNNHLKSEAITCSTEDRDELEKSLQLVSEERDALKKEMETSQSKLAEARTRIVGLLEQNHEDMDIDVTDIPALVNALLTKTQRERLTLTMRCDERMAQLTGEVESMRQESSQQQAELQACVEDLSREKSLLKGTLDEVVSDTEALQRDLSEMKTMNEKIRLENQELLAEIAEVTEKLSTEEQADRSEKSSDEINDEKKEFQQLLTEKESLISQLREDIALLEETKENSSASNENNMKQFAEKIEVLENEKKQKDEKMNKIKAVAVKAKKELDNSRKEVLKLKEEVEALKADRDKVSSSMKDIIHGAEGYKNLMVDYDKQTEQLDKEREKLEGAERQIGDLAKRLQVAVQQHEQLTSDREDLMARIETLQSNARQLEAQALEMHKLKSVLERDLEGEKILKEQKAKDHSSAVREADELQAQLRRQKHQLQQTAQELEQLRKDAQQSSLMDMEMADYERLVKELNHKLSEKDSQAEELEAQIQTRKKKEERLNEEIDSLKSLVDQGDEKSSKMKQLLVKTKKDFADAKKHEAAQMIVRTSLKGELEAQQQQLEDYKIQCSELTAERHRLQEQLKSLTEQQQRTTSSFQHRLSVLQDECSSAKSELAATASEFEGYKVRVHNVLKQQKSKSSAQRAGDVTKQERENMEGMLAQLRARLQDTQHSLQSSGAELQQLQTEHDTLLERHNKILQETVVKEAELRERLLSFQSENMALKSEHAQTVSRLTAQADALRSSYREQQRHLQDEHRSTVETLQQQMGRLENQLFLLQKEPSSTSSAPAQQSRKPLQDRKSAELPLFDLQSMAREDGEGMETTETESVSSTGTPLPSLEQLLTSPDPKHEPFVWQVEPTKEELSQKLNTANRSMEHMNGLLHETEATNAILMEQITLLKSELRRLERNQEREKSVANLEYLKNVLLQFIFLRSGSERQALLPVIHTMLQLSPEEKSKLAAIAQGEEEADGNRGSGWTSYLHSWSGIR